ncbi:DUF3048 domain-containing protein [Nocardioides sp. cx-169]|uniref:DUF3048 domain-containing protein n=1 Tax=Nocardioides sp. cx-169 TaxID=2899080 RepID=UPI001E2F8DF6|nr:DUF3048 domain-containing protein [Nocardioides sp. cx-169]MCD4533970.1 DUF3048 domain-containing protein [Nocardioides sp. cx-169]
MRSARLLASIVVTGSLLLAGCGGDDKGGGKDEPEAQGSSLPEAPDTWPLTGLPVPKGQQAEQEHPVMVLKMDNTSSSAPQVGLGKADLVVEELVEGGVTRLAAFYYSTIPGEVGPVRSMRASDIGIVAPVDAAMVTSGAAPVTIERIKDAGIDFFAEGAKGFYREGGRSAPYNLFTDMKKTATLVKQDAARPDDYLPWGKAADLPKGQPATRIAASFSGGHTTNWVFRDKGYVNENSYAAEGDEFPADTVLVLRVKVGDAGYRDPAGNPVPETKFEGKGAALLFHQGRLVRGTWSKKSLEAPLELATKAGELVVPTGRTFIELVPAGNGGDVSFE